MASASQTAHASAASSSTNHAVTSPWDGKTLGSVTFADQAAINQAIAKAQSAAVAWADRTIKDRVQPLYKLKTILETHIDDISTLAHQESGKTLDEARAEVRKGIEVVEYACSMPVDLAGGSLEVSRGVDCYSKYMPLGVVAGVTPFNFPAMVPLWMIPIAIAAGNSFIHKPSEQVPLTAHRISDYLHDAGLPEHVHTVLDGDRTVVEHLCDHRDIQAVAFVGSTAAARSVYHRASAADKRVLALGGAKNHVVVLPDADVAMTAAGVVASAYGCAGQRCMAASVLILVGNCDHILEAIISETNKLTLGNDLGAVIHNAAKNRLNNAISAAEKRGIRLAVDGRGKAPAGLEQGSWLGPTILDGVKADDACLAEEWFGPVLTVVRVRTLEEAIALENTCPYGNAASLFTRSGAAAARFERQTHAGMIGINIGVPVPREPFGFGGFNASRFGSGDITGREGALFWCKTRKVTRKWAASDAVDWMS